MKEYRKIFVICRKDGDIEHSDNYCKHGPNNTLSVLL